MKPIWYNEQFLLRKGIADGLQIKTEVHLAELNLVSLHDTLP